MSRRGDVRPPEGPKTRRCGELLRDQPVAKGLRTNAPRIKRNRRWAKRVRRTSRGSVRRTSHLRASLEMPSVTLRTTSSGGPNRSGPTMLWCWLARKDSNLRSPDPESVARIRPREPPFERAAGFRRPPNRGESGAHSEMSQTLIPQTERVCCPIWATQILDHFEGWTRMNATQHRAIRAVRAVLNPASPPPATTTS